MNIWKYTLKYCHLRTSCDPSCTLHQPTRWPPLFLRVRAHYHTCVYYGICVFVENFRPVWYVSVYAYIFYTHGICKVYNLFSMSSRWLHQQFPTRQISLSVYEHQVLFLAPETLFWLNNISWTVKHHDQLTNPGKKPKKIHLHTGVSKNRGTPKWMVYNGKPY